MPSDSDLPPTPPSESASVTPMVDPTIPAVSSTTGLTSNVAAGLAVIFSFFGGIVFLLVEKRDKFVRFWAMQSLVLGLAYLAFCFFTYVVNFIFRGPLGFISFFWDLFAWVVQVGIFILYVVMLIQAFSGKEWQVPYVGKIAREQLARIRF